MQNVAKKQNATVAMAFLFVSLVMPLSLKAVGISPNLSAGVEAWHRIAGIFAESHQPADGAELLALNRATEDSSRNESSLLAGELLASAQPLDVQLSATLVPSVSESVTTSRPSSPRCPKTARLAPRSMAVVPVAPIVRDVEVSVEGLSGEALNAAEAAKAAVPVRREVMRRYEQAVANYRVNLGEAMRVLPKDFKVMLKIKPAAMPAPPAVTTCAFRKSFSPETVKQLRSAWSFTVPNTANSIEKSEL
jgi:hypothetical protein